MILYKLIKNIITLTLFTTMFFFFNKSQASYDQVFYDLNIKGIDGNNIQLSNYKNKAVLLVNVASKCGFTNQYKDLQTLWTMYEKKGLIIIGVPTNQFGNQEPGSDNEIKNFCETNFDITFPMSTKIEVKGPNAHEIYKWAKKNYGKATIPKWNFHKILINKEGKIENTYASFTNPTSKKIIRDIENILSKN